MEREIIPLRQRKSDIAVLAFFFVNLFFITYIVDLEQLVIANVANFQYPIWPPKIFVDMVHWYGATFDPAQMNRPVWWKMTIWIDVLVFGPYYAAAIYAFIKGKEWIRIPTIITSTALITNVVIILGEEVSGQYPALNLPFVILVNLPWLLFPLWNLWRMSFNEHPFTRLKNPAKEQTVPVQKAEESL